MAFTPYLNFMGTCRAAFTRTSSFHAALQIGDALLMASDAPGSGAPVSTYVHYEAKDVGDAKRVFDALSEGGEVEMPS